MTDPSPTDTPNAGELAAAVAQALTAHGPLTDDELEDVLTAAGVDLGEDPDETLAELLDAELNDVVELADGPLAWGPALLAGRLFTHRVDPHELGHDLLRVTPDLEPVAQLADRHGHGLALAFPGLDAELFAERGIPAELADGDALLLPAGRLAGLGVAAGDLVGLRVTADGVTLEPVRAANVPAGSPAALADRVRAVLASNPGEPLPVAETIWTVCAADPALFTEPLPPLGDLFDALGVPRDGEWLAEPGFDFTGWRVRQRAAAIAQRHDLTEDEALAVLVTLSLYQRVSDLVETVKDVEEGADASALAALLAEADSSTSDGEIAAAAAGERRTVRATLALLGEPAVAEAVLAETAGDGRTGAAALGLFAESVEPMAPRPARVALRWLRGHAHERLGEITAAEQTLRAAESLDPHWGPVLLDLARYASDRGDAAHGLTLLARAGTPAEHPLRQLLERYTAPPRPGLGRNQPCWCGSSRKYKQCHLRHEQFPLDERAGWLYQKAVAHLLADDSYRDLLLDLAAERARYADEPDALFAALNDPLVVDAALVEGGAFADFLTTRGDLLPEDARLLAEQWQLIDRSLFEVDTVHPGHGIELRDLRTGDHHHVRERTASRQLKPGDLLCTRILPAGDTLQIFGRAEPVSLQHRDPLLTLLDDQPDPEQLVAFLTSRFAPITLANTEGDPLVLCHATLHTPDPTALTAALDRRYDRDENGAPEWTEHVITDGTPRIRATLRLNGNQLHVDTNSEPRLDRVLTALRDAQPDITITDQTRQPIRDTRELQNMPRPTGGASEPLDPSDPAVAALDQFTRDYENRWLDQPIPALAGQTPRQAADDPTRRPDLIRLLDTFPVSDQPGLMNPDRIRAALNLT